MDHLFFALFDTHQAATAAILELEALGTPRQQCTVVMHQGTIQDPDLGKGETNAAATAVQSFLASGAVGALMGGLVLSPLGILAVGPMAAALATGGAASLVGGLAGVLAGAEVLEPVVESMAAAVEAGKVLVTVRAPTLAIREDAEAVFRSLGAVVQEKSGA